MEKRIKPFLKWAGGKRWLIENYDHLIPKQFNRYIEPFVGSGAVYFYLQPERALIGDSNKDLIDTYRSIKKDWKLVYKLLTKHHKKHSYSYYYEIRQKRFATLEERAAQFIYLNRTCWNGLYRVNLKGEFNVPIGTKTNVIRDDDEFELISAQLRHTKLYNRDFEYLVDQASEGDLLFIDPPYTVLHNFNGFIKYNEKLFSWSDQERLYNALSRAKERGALILATNGYHKSTCKLYKTEFEIQPVKRVSNISGNPFYRGQYEELIIKG
jgi:DNA adenine methylase